MNSSKKEFVPNKQHKSAQNNAYKNIPNNKKQSGKNLSPAKKFRLRLKRAKFQRRQQARDEYFEHDMRENNQRKKKKKPIRFRPNHVQNQPRRFQNSRNAVATNETANNSKSHSTLPPNKINSSKEKKVDVLKKTTNIISSYSASQETVSLVNSEQTKQENEDVSSPISLYQANTNVSNFSNTMKCCCHCACGSKRKPRRKLSSPYLGDFSKIVHFSGGNCPAGNLKSDVLNEYDNSCYSFEQTSSGGNTFMPKTVEIRKNGTRCVVRSVQVF